MLYLPHIRRPPRAGEWTEGKAVSFIVTIAARGNVTLAARAAGMSRKSAYALRDRDTSFAASWDAALVIARSKVTAKIDSKVYNPPFAPPRGDSVALRNSDASRRNRFFATLANRPSDSAWPPLAPSTTLP